VTMFPLKETDITKVRLGNGLLVMGLEYHKLPLVYMSLMIKNGSERDPAGKEGLADLTAEMVTLGTEVRDSQQLALEMEQLGARYSASSGPDASFVEVVGLADTFTTLMDLLGDMLLRPAFPQLEMQLSQQRRIASLIQQRDQAEVVADEIICQRLLTGTPYAHPAYGTMQSLGGLSAEDPRSFYRRHYSPGEAVLLVIGDLTPEEIRQRAEGMLGQWKGAGKSEAQLPQPTRPRGRRIIAVNRPDLTQSQIRIGLLGIKRKDADYIPFKVMNYIFGGGGFSCRLMQRIRAEKGYTYGIGSAFQAGRITGPFIISTFTPTATTAPVIEEIFKVMEEFISEGARAQELEDAKRFFTGSFPLKLETPGQMAGELLQLELYDIPFDYLSSYRAAIEEVTLNKINGLAAAYFVPEDLILVVVGRVEEFMEPLRSWGDVEIVEYSEITKGSVPSNTSKHASTTCRS
jgi:zinc protease